MEKITKERVRAMRLAYLSTVFEIIQLQTLTGSMISLYGIKVGLNDSLIGLLNSPIHLFAVVRLFFAPTVDRWGKKTLLLPTGIVSSLLIGLLFLVPHFGREKGAGVAGILLIGVVFLVFLIRQAGQAAWFPILQDIVPQAYLGRFFARLRMSWQTSSVVFFLAAGIYFGAQATYGKFNVIFAAAIVGGLLRLLFILFIPEKPREPTPARDEKARSDFFVPFRKHAFRQIMGVAFLTSLAVGIAFPFFAVFMKRGLGHGDDFVLVATSLSSLGFLVTLLGWGVLCDRHGTRAIFALSLSGMGAVYLFWLAVLPGARSAEFLPLLLYLLRGACVAGMGIAQTRYVFGVVPRQRSARYFAWWNMCAALGAGAGPIAAGCLARACLKAGWSPQALFWNPYKLLFLVSVAVTVGAGLVAMRLPRAREKGAAEILSLLVVTGRLRILGAIRRNRRRGKN